MKVAFFVFPRVTTLDYVGVYDALRRGAVSSSLDVGLLLVQKLFGDEERARVAVAMNVVN